TVSSSSATSMTSAGIAVVPSSAHHFSLATIASPVTGGVPVVVTVRAVNASNNTVPNYSGDALLIANTGAGSISPELIAFTNGVWTGHVVVRWVGGAGGVTRV